MQNDSKENTISTWLLLYASWYFSTPKWELCAFNVLNSDPDHLQRTYLAVVRKNVCLFFLPLCSILWSLIFSCGYCRECDAVIGISTCTGISIIDTGKRARVNLSLEAADVLADHLILCVCLQQKTIVMTPDQYCLV